jgi:hypothetical protein
MSRMSELQYPDAPGFKVAGPSEAAATSIASTAKTLREQVLRTIASSSHGLTADEVAAKLNKSILSVRPRVSELRRQGEIRQAPTRGKNDSGMSASVWVVSPKLGGGA